VIDSAGAVNGGFSLRQGFGGEDDGVLCGVFDGHGPHGHLVARRARDSLPLRLMSAARASSKNGLD
jgi:serine/threonine protein phosphatase PrpC